MYLERRQMELESELNIINGEPDAIQKETNYYNAIAAAEELQKMIEQNAESIRNQNVRDKATQIQLDIARAAAEYVPGDSEVARYAQDLQTFISR